LILKIPQLNPPYHSWKKKTKRHKLLSATGMSANRYLYTWSKNDVISSVRKHYCALRLGLGLELGLGLG